MRRRDDTGPYVIDNLEARRFPALGIALSYAQTKVAAGIPRIRILRNGDLVAQVWRDEEQRAILTTAKEDV